MRGNGNRIVSVLGDKRICQVNHVERKIGIATLLADGVPIHQQSAAHDHEVARRPDASSVLLRRSVLESVESGRVR